MGQNLPDWAQATLLFSLAGYLHHLPKTKIFETDLQA